jgi:hypothetical protein
MSRLNIVRNISMIYQPESYHFHVLYAVIRPETRGYAAQRNEDRWPQLNRSNRVILSEIWMVTYHASQDLVTNLCENNI